MRMHTWFGNINNTFSYVNKYKIGTPTHKKFLRWLVISKTCDCITAILKYITCIEFYILLGFQIHDVEFAANLDEVINETLPALEQVVKQGKARYIGVTGYPLDILKEAISRAPGRFQVMRD